MSSSSSNTTDEMIGALKKPGYKATSDSVDDLRKLVREIYCSTVHSLNLEVVQTWLHAVQSIGELLTRQEDKWPIESRAMHLRLTTYWNEILYAIVGHVRSAPNLLGQSFQKSGANKKVVVNDSIACFSHFCSQVGHAWTTGVNDIVALLRTILVILQEHEEDTTQVEAWIRQAMESQGNISAACNEYQKTFKVLSCVSDKEVPSEAALMHNLYRMCTDTRLQSEIASHMQNKLLMGERLIASNAVYEAKVAVLKAWNKAVSNLLASIVRNWLQDTLVTCTKGYVAALGSVHGLARILASAMVGTDIIESEYVRNKVQSSTVKSVQSSLLNDLRHETNQIQDLRSESHLGPEAEQSWQVLSQAIEQAVASLGNAYEAGPVDQLVLSRGYVEASSCLERYEQVARLLRHFALYETNTASYCSQLADACEKLASGLSSRLACKVNNVRGDLTVRQVDLLVRLRGRRKDRRIPDGFPVLFQSVLQDWILEFEKVVTDMRQELQATPDDKKIELQLVGAHEEVTEITRSAFSTEVWQTNGVNTLAIKGIVKPFPNDAGKKRSELTACSVSTTADGRRLMQTFP
ncbi:uncharacterized protein LOC135377281 [Ornithodoros turicata]|uniref:uncharacterized protein LOC135377281 n=1 Tax=Ornithodoros turicata TaxID=34597 RepID=UPI003139DEC1